MNTKKTGKQTAPKAATVAALPPDVTAADLRYPTAKNQLGYKEVEAMGLVATYGTFTLYFVPKIGWVLTTLHISNPSSRQSAGTSARFYGIGVSDGKVYTVGRGPHVTAEVVVHTTKDNADRLKRYADLWTKGMADASQIRDRISSRRAQGQLHRAAGESSWRW